MRLAPTYDVVPQVHLENDGQLALAVDSKYRHWDIAADDRSAEFSSWGLRRAAATVDATLERLEEAVKAEFPLDRAFPALQEQIRVSPTGYATESADTAGGATPMLPSRHGRIDNVFDRRPTALCGQRSTHMNIARHRVDSRFAHRATSTTVTVVDAAGAPLAGREVTVEQTRHAFGFGNIGFDFVGFANDETDADAANIFGGSRPSRAAALEPLWFGLYNHVTLPFYWRGFELREGHPDTDRMMAAARYFGARGATIKGHPLLWHTLAPQWLMDKSDAEVEATIRARIRRDVTAFAGVIDLWDAINEAVILPVFAAEDNAVTRLAHSKGQLEMVRMAFEEARAANPAGRFVLNDFDLSADYEDLISRCLDAGIGIDAIGVQTHMHQGYRGEDAITSILDRFGRFGLPVQMTETTLLSGEIMPARIVDLNDYQVQSWPSTPEGEERQAEEMVRHYRNVFAHPATESLTYWGLADEGAWLGAPSGLVRVDGTAKPAYFALRDLIKGEWWMSPTTVVTDDAGRVTIDGVAGMYAITAAGASATVDASSSGLREATVTVG